MKNGRGGYTGNRILMVDRQGVCRDFPGATTPLFDLTKRTGSVTVSSTSSASPTVCIQMANPIRCSGRTRMRFEAWGWMQMTNTETFRFSFWNDTLSVNLGEFETAWPNSNPGAAYMPVHFALYHTPPVGMSKFSLRCYRSVGATDGVFTYQNTGQWMRINGISVGSLTA